MYSTSVDFKTIRAVRPALTAFAAQVIKKKLVREAEEAVKPTSGLHIASLKTNEARSAWLQWSDIGSTTVTKVTDIVEHLQPLTWDYVMAMCMRPQRTRNGIVSVCKTHPV